VASNACDKSREINSLDDRPLEKPPITYKILLTITVACTSLGSVGAEFTTKNKHLSNIKNIKKMFIMFK
ncbi:3551_t:CDS:1, partial [Entrophospora sp. SA101]